MTDETREFPSMEQVREAQEAIHRRVEEEEKAHAAGGNGDGSDGNDGGPSSAFVRECLEANELGDGMLYSAMNRDRVIYNKSANEWLAWRGHHWARDTRDQHLADVERVVDRYLDEVLQVDKEINEAVKKGNKDVQPRLEAIRKKLFGRVSRLRTDRGRTACVKFARTHQEPMVITGEDLDLHPWLLPCANGVINLESGKFRDGRQDEYLTVSSPTAWKGIEEPCPEWENALLDIFERDQELVEYLQRLLGYAITGLTIEPIFPVLWGQGRNGKDMIVKVVTYVLGRLAGSIQSEMLLAQKVSKSAAGPSPDIMGLKGLRLAWASETDEGRQFSASRVKWLTGGGQLVGRNPHDKYEVRFEPTHTLFLLTNSKPHAAADDFAFWERLHLIPFRLSFVNRKPMASNERPAVKGLGDKIKASEAPGILAWLVRGCIQYQKRGLQPPESVLEATAEYRRDEDLLADFLEEMCTVEDRAQAKATDLFDLFSKWFFKNVSKRGFSQKRFGKLMSNRFERKKIQGYTYYVGLDLSAEGQDILFGDEK